MSLCVQKKQLIKKQLMMTNIAIFASGAGSNARRILEHFQHHPTIRVALVASNRKAAGVLDIAAEFGVETFIITKNMLSQIETHPDLPQKLAVLGIDYIVLAGFLVLMPQQLVHHYDGRIFNIHPALLPKFGGQGMYGKHVHEAVHAAAETETGITIHLVNEFYDKGAMLFQAKIPISAADTPAEIARKVLLLEHHHYPQVIERQIFKDRIKN
jgi:phosphoribosylglycinamide formyltransferase 1